MPCSSTVSACHTLFDTCLLSIPMDKTYFCLSSLTNTSHLDPTARLSELPCFPLWIQKFGILMQKFPGFKDSPGSGGVVADDVYSGSLGPGSFVWEEVFDRHCWLSIHGLLFSLYQKTVRGLGFAGRFLEEHFQVMLFARWLTEEKNPWPAFSLWMSGYHS